MDLLEIDDVPEYLKDNINILSGYRRELNLKRAILTIFMWHNETLNIWSHILSSLLFISFSIWFAFYDDGGNDNPKWPLIMFFLGSIYLFTVSATFHTLQCVSSKHYGFWRKMDFIAIIILMFSMFIPFCYYGFSGCENRIMLFSIYVSISGIISIISVSICTLPIFQTNRFSFFRPVVFALNGAYSIAPILHVAVIRWYLPVIKNVIICIGVQMFCHIIGATFYVLKVPERIKQRLIVRDYCPTNEEKEKHGNNNNNNNNNNIQTILNQIYNTNADKKNNYRIVDFTRSHFIFHCLVSMGLVVYGFGNFLLYQNIA